MDYRFDNIKDAHGFCNKVNEGEGRQYCEPWEVGEHWEVVNDTTTQKYYADFRSIYTPPPMSSNLVAIPDKFEWVFRNDRFELNGFVVELIRTPDKELCVDVAYLRWQAFQDELDKPENATVKQSLEPVWDYVLEIAIENEYI